MIKVIEKAFWGTWKITLYKNVLKDSLVQRFLELLDGLVEQPLDKHRVMENYRDFAVEFLAKEGFFRKNKGNPWSEYILDLILYDDNPYTREAERIDYEDIPASLNRLAAQDIHYLQILASIKSADILQVLQDRLGEDQEDNEWFLNWEELKYSSIDYPEDPIDIIKASFSAKENWEDGLKELTEYYRKNGTGIFGKYYSLRWIKEDEQGKLVGVKNPDNITLDQLYEYEREQRKVLQNTEQFLKGYPANNVLLYGDRGTGKSSTVKALVNEYGIKGLRLVEIQRQDLKDFPMIIDCLAKHSLKFILYVDDLSFGEQETQYRELKALLEGGLETRPRNIVVYATSNRRHLVQENFNDRSITGLDPDNEDVRYMDTMQEKLSLADRFGIAVTFTAPDQKRYLSIVEKLAEERDLNIEQEELFQMALKWELSYNSRSARTAKQFIDHLEGQLAMDSLNIAK